MYLCGSQWFSVVLMGVDLEYGFTDLVGVDLWILVDLMGVNTGISVA